MRIPLFQSRKKSPPFAPVLAPPLALVACRDLFHEREAKFRTAVGRFLARATVSREEVARRVAHESGLRILVASVQEVRSFETSQLFAQEPLEWQAFSFLSGAYQAEMAILHMRNTAQRVEMALEDFPEFDGNIFRGYFPDSEDSARLFRWSDGSTAERKEAYQAARRMELTFNLLDGLKHSPFGRRFRGIATRRERLQLWFHERLHGPLHPEATRLGFQRAMALMEAFAEKVTYARNDMAMMGEPSSSGEDGANEQVFNQARMQRSSFLTAYLHARMKECLGDFWQRVCVSAASGSEIGQGTR